jgi:D-tyrosyl-tRNA(Tyr) deacylase
MRAILQRTTGASVSCGDHHESIGNGLVILLGIESTDHYSDVEWLVGKIARMRIFGNDEGKMNLSVSDIGGELLVISQFTLHASTRKGNRPSFLRAADPTQAEPLYQDFCRQLAEISGCTVKRGVFGGDMKVSLINDGPVTIVIDSRAKE